MLSKWKILPSSQGGKEGTVRPLQTGTEVVVDARRSKFTSRLVRAFSRPTNAKIPLEQTGPFLSMPYELLEKVFDSIESKRDLCHLRQTCAQLNEYLEPMVFRELVIDSETHGSHPTGHLLKALSTGKASCSHLTTTLRISNMLIFSSPAQSNWLNPNIDSSLQPLQERYIAPALQALRSLKQIYWNLKIKDPYNLMVDGIAGGSCLEELYITFDHWVSSSVFPVERFSNLTVLALGSGDYTHSLSTGMVASLKKTLQSSPNLIDLRIGIRIDGDPTLDDIFSDSLGPCRFRLSHIRALDEYWLSFNHSWDILSNLTSVDIPNVWETSTFALWSAFESKNVRLRSITVDTLSPALVHYLVSYSGLERLQISKTRDWDEEIVGQLYLKVLERHQRSLSSFLLRLSHMLQASMVKWALRPQFLESILQCVQLRELAFPLVYRKPGESWHPDMMTLLLISVGDTLRALTQLPHLRHVHIAPIFHFPAALCTHMNLVEISRGTAAAFFLEVEDMNVPELDTFKFGLQLFHSYFRVVREDVGGERRYVFKDLKPSCSSASVV